MEIGSTPKDSVSTTRSSRQNYNADGTASGPCGSSSLPVLGSQTERAPAGLPPQSAWASGRLNFSFGGNNIDVPTEGNLASYAPSTTLGSQERESMEVQENPHGVRESKGISGGASQRVEVCSGKSPEEPSGSVSLQPSRLDNKQKRRVEGSNPIVMNKDLQTSSNYQGYRGNREENFDIRRGGSRGGYGYQREENDARSGNEGGWDRSRGGRGGRGRYRSQRGESDRIDALG